MLLSRDFPKQGTAPGSSGLLEPNVDEVDKFRRRRPLAKWCVRQVGPIMIGLVLGTVLQ